MEVTLERRGPTDSYPVLAPAFVVREAVFVREQAVSRRIEYDGHDREAVHVLAFADDTPVGTARIRLPTSSTAKFERLAVLKAYRNQGIGGRIFAELESIARERGCTEAVFHAQQRLLAFYKRRGYEPVGDPFDEAGIPHVKMRRVL